MASLNSLRPLCGRLSQLSIQPIRTVPFAPVAAPFAAFSTSSMQQAPKFRKQITREKKKQGRALRRRRDQNKQRGVSSIHRSGPKHKISMSNVPLPEPADYKPTVPLDEKHGLWGFFPKPGTLMETPDEMIKHGRAWTVEELRRKSWEDLHGLWWVCCKEKNMLSTAREELKRSKMGFGDQELALREQEVRKTQRAIKHALTERMYTWQDARQAARSDPEIDMESRTGNPYLPSSYEEEPMAAVEDALAEEGEDVIKDEMKAEAKKEKAVKQPEVPA